MKKTKKVLLVNHFYFTKSGPVNGPANVICEYLKNHSVQYLFLNYPLILGSRSFFEKNDGKSTIHKNFGLNINIPLPIKSLFEVINTIFFGFLYHADIYIAIDPLNALPGVFLKKLGLVKKTIFYSVDYTPTRFENVFLNAAYQKIDKFCAKFSDEVWNVSLRIVELRRRQKVVERKIKFLPNTPNFTTCPRLPVSEINRNKIVMVMGSPHIPILPLVLESFKKVSKMYPKIILEVIGTGDYEGKLKEKVSKMGLSSKVKFLGQLNYEVLLSEVAKCGIGLALYSYSKEHSWVYYGDSKKARECLACGVPVIINDVVATSEDIKKYKAGLVVKLEVEDVFKAIEKILSNYNFWVKCRNNSIKLAKIYDFETLLDKLLNKLK